MKSTKSGRQRRIPLTADTRAILAGWKAECDERARVAEVEMLPDAYVLSAWPDNSRPLNPDTLSAHVTRVAKDLDMRHIHLHSLRHYAATQMLAGGVSPREVAEALGHSDGGRLALQVYGHPTGEGQMAAAEAMSAALPSPSRNAEMPPAQP
jgi:integrase